MYEKISTSVVSYIIGAHAVHFMLLVNTAE